MSSTQFIGRLLIAATLSMIVTPAAGQKVYLVAGNVVRPDDLTPDDEPRIGSEIVVDDDGLVVISEGWADSANRPCVSWTIISNTRYTVQSRRRGGQCPTTPSNDALSVAGNGQPMEVQMVFYNDGKFDRETQPEAVQRSLGRLDDANRRLHAVKNRMDQAAHSNPASKGRIEARLGREILAARRAKQRAIEAAAQSTSARDITGIWKDTQLDGVYYIRQVGNQVWWYGMSNDDGASWSNVFHGERDGDVIKGMWADVPQGRASSQGQLAFEITSARAIRIVGQTGGFGTQTLAR